ncbi:MAG: Crp/Fnr family transcriptional regulator [Deltaproteobacteria bacterium]|nr:Crp/Fnr family transcriptional regulator [Deltaproteobacteria bacterium]
MLEGEPRKANDLELLARIKGLGWLSSAQQKRLAAAFTSYDVGRDDLIFSDDASRDSDLFILLSGAARFSCIGVKRGRIAIAVVAPGVIPKPPVLAHFNCQFRCEALRHSRIAKLPRESFVEVLLGVRSPNFDRVATLVFGGLDKMLTRYPGFTGLDLRSRVAQALLELGASFGARNSRGIVLTITPTQQELADLVGASRPKISIVLSEFIRRRAIYREGRRIAIVPSRLEEMAQFVVTTG